jgi:hypothetical protein
MIAVDIMAFVLLLFTDRPWVFAFEVKFYPTEPSTLHEDLTRLRSHPVIYLSVSS